jgi:hypothetical protein
MVPFSTSTAIDGYIENKLNIEIAARLKDQGSLVRELSDKAEDVVWARFKRYGVLVGILAAGVLGIIAFVGIKTVDDISRRLEPIVSAAEQRAQARIGSLKASLDQLSQDVANQTNRVSAKNGEILQEFARLDALSKQINGMVKSLQTNVQQVSKQVDVLSVRKAYPTLGMPRIVTYESQPWSGRTTKKATDKWVSIYIDPPSIGEFSPQQIDNLVKSLKAARYTSYLGLFGISGPISQGFGPLRKR